MNLSKLRKIHVIIIGVFLCIVSGVAIFYLMIKPQREAYAAAKARYDSALVLGNPQAEQSAIADLQNAQVQVQLAQQTLDAQMQRRMPDLSFARRDIGMLSLWNEQIRTLGPLLENFAQDKNVKVAPLAIQIPAPPVNPNSEVFEKDVIEFNVGPIIAMGDFKSLMNHLRRWNNCRRLVMVSEPKLAGVSPALVLTYNLKCYIFPAVKATAESKIPIAGDGGGASQ